jgi:hypothetical protein
MGIAKRIKKAAFELSQKKFPGSKIFGLTTGAAVMKINTELGYVPVTFSALTTDPVFWKGCESCVNFDVLSRNNYTRCLCTGMLYDPEVQGKKQEKLIKEEHHDKSMKWLLKVRNLLSRSDA